MAAIKKTQNVAISKKQYDLIAKFCRTNGYRIGWFFEAAALKEMKKEAAMKK